MMKTRVAADGVSRFQPSQSLAGTVEHPAAKSSAKPSIVQVAYLVISCVPFAQDFDGSGESGRPFGRSARLIGFDVGEGQKACDSDDARQCHPLPGEKEGQHRLTLPIRDGWS
jgi:hypothetical protein